MNILAFQRVRIDQMYLEFNFMGLFNAEFQFLFVLLPMDQHILGNPKVQGDLGYKKYLAHKCLEFNFEKVLEK